MPACTPEECDALFARHMNAADVEAVVALYEPGASLIQEDGRSATGHRAIREALSPFAAMRPTLRMNVHRVVRAGDDLAVLYNDWSASVHGPDGPAEVAGKAIEIVRRQPDGAWLFAIDDPWARG